jgi:uncharacterized Zn finger protein (UPF0148 family)
MSYVICSKCGDPVAGRLAGELICVHCGNKFELHKADVLSGPVFFNSLRNRWQVG